MWCACVHSDGAISPVLASVVPPSERELEGPSPTPATRADLPDVLALIASGAFSPALVTTQLADWKDAHEAFLEDTTKVVVRRSPMFARRPMVERGPSVAR